MSRFIEFEASAPLDDTHSSTEDSTRVSDEEFIDNRPIKAGELDMIDDFVKLPSGLGSLPVGYSVAAEEEAEVSPEDTTCPDNLEEMMFIVRSLRGDVHDVFDPDLDVDVGTTQLPVTIDLDDDGQAVDKNT